MNALFEFWDRRFSKEDPWSSSDHYEVAKRLHTLELVPNEISRALELGCAEGHFTVELLKRVQSLLAVDISGVALERAKRRCSHSAKVSFQFADAFKSLPDGKFDLIVCSEVLYYARNKWALERLITKIERKLAPAGYLLLTHPYLVADDRSRTGFDFNEIGASYISSRVARRRRFVFVQELRTELYSVQLFQNVRQRPASKMPREVLIRQAQLNSTDRSFGLVRWGGCNITAAEAKHLWRSPRIPILMYHRIADEGPRELAPYRVHPEAFERQLAFLRRHGYSTIGLLRAHELLNKKQTPAGRLVVITFDDAYADFYTTALPLLRKYGFTATVFVPTQYVGRTAEWDREHGSAAKMMSWDQIRQAQVQNIDFGSHTVSHRVLKKLKPEDVQWEVETSRAELSEKLGRAVSLFSYPYGNQSSTIRSKVKEAGYSLAVAGSGLAAKGSDPFALPRQEILSSMSFDEWILKLGDPEPAPIGSRLYYYSLRLMRDRRTYMRI